MTTIRITKEFKFETAHMLKGYDGLCANIHGHSYKLFVTITGKTNEDVSNPKLGMLMDFGDLKEIVYQEIVHKFDHSLVVNEAATEETKKEIGGITKRLILTPYQPTCENLVADFARIISSRLPKHIKLYSLRLHETANSCAEWFASDNP